MAKRVIRIALLLCDTPVPAVVAQYGNYYDIYQTWLTQTLASYPDQSISENTELVIDGFDVVDKQEYPSEERLRNGHYDAVMLTGSRHDAFDTSLPFIPPVIRFLQSLANTPATQHVRIVGVCFGHQVLSVALGGKCVRGENGWEIGVYGNEVTKEGEYWWCGDVKGQGGDQRVYIQQMHRDHVPELPPDFHLLLKSERYPIHSMIRYHPASTSSNPLAQILTVQGHPEYTPDIVSRMVDTRSASGVFDPDTTREARRRLGGKDGTGGEGFGKVGWAIFRVLLQEVPKYGDVDGDVEMNGSSAVLNNHSNASTSQGESSRYAAVDRILDRRGPWTDEQFVGGIQAKSFLRETAKVLVIGAGGLGCEILQNLALTGFTNIHVIDMDTIDISNLNRQFLFREADVGNSKAETAARFVMDRVPGVTVTAYHGKIQDHDQDFYLQFDIVIAGLDSISARRWINATLVDMVDSENPESLKPLIDGGTEGFKGQARVILPTVTSCYECSIDMLTPPTVYPICTIANTPRLPEHCIEWASVLQWPKIKKDLKLDTDDPDHIEWLYREAAARAAEFSIVGVTWALTQGVVKNIIPAIASTNAIIAASCCNEAFKIATTSAPYLNNYMMYTGNDSIYTFTFEHEKRPECPVCGGESATVKVDSSWTLEQLVEHLKGNDFKLTRPSLSGPSGPLFWSEPPAIYEATKRNLEKQVSELLDHGTVISVTDPNLPSANLSLVLEIK